MSEREKVRKRHNDDQEKADNFIKKEWPVDVLQFVTSKQFVTYSVSTTQYSTILILAIGFETIFTRNTYSADEDHPWLICGKCLGNVKTLAQWITSQWESMHTPGERAQVDLIAKHIVYELVDDKFILRKLVCDASNNVRVRINDIEIWSHPPRDEPLRRALEEDATFKQREGNVKACARQCSRILKSPNYPQERKETKLDELCEKLDRLYDEYYRKVQIPTSYQWPTLQLSINPNYNPSQAQHHHQAQQRYGDTFAGVYGNSDNEVHHKFPNSKVVARIIPSKGEVFIALMTKENIQLSFDELNNVKNGS